jgi:hypothetical protein
MLSRTTPFDLGNPWLELFLMLPEIRTQYLTLSLCDNDDVVLLPQDTGIVLARRICNRITYGSDKVKCHE